MTANEGKEILLWSVGINYPILLVWFGVFFLAHDWFFRMRTRWFKLSAETFDAIDYAGMATYKIGVLLLDVVPIIALCVTLRQPR